MHQKARNTGISKSLACLGFRGHCICKIADMSVIQMSVIQMSVIQMPVIQMSVIQIQPAIEKSIRKEKGKKGIVKGRKSIW